MAKTKHDLSKLEVGDDFTVGDKTYEVAGVDPLYDSNAFSGIKSYTIHIRDKDFRTTQAPEDIRGSSEFQKSMMNDHVSPPGSDDPLEGMRAQLDYPEGGEPKDRFVDSKKFEENRKSASKKPS